MNNTSIAKNNKLILITIGGGIFNFSCNSISAYVRDKGFDVEIINCHTSPITKLLTDNQLLHVNELCYGCLAIGVSITAIHQVPAAIQLTNHLKGLFKLPVVWGGVPVITDPAYYLRYVDYVCTGEGEVFMYKFMKQIVMGESLIDVDGMAYKSDDNGSIVFNPKLPLVDINKIPLPNPDISNIYIITPNGLKSGKNDYNEILSNAVSKYGYRVFQTRGCPYRCSFCANNSLAKVDRGLSKLRSLTVSRMIQELQYAMSIVPNLEKIMFYEDDFFAKNISSFKRVIDQYSKSIGLDINANGTIRQITEEKIDYILDNGIKIDFLKVGLQSPSERINKDVYLRSHFRCQDYLEKLPMMARKRIRVIVDIISDNPYETTTDKVDGIKFYIKLSLALSCVDESWKYISFMDHKLMFYPGTELYQRAIQDRTIPYDYIEKVLLSRTTERSLDQVDIDSIIIGLFRLSLKYYQIIWIMRIISHEKILSLVISSLRSRIVMITLANFKKILRYKLKR